MKLQENINRIKEMMGLITESSAPTVESLFDLLVNNGFNESTEDDFTNIIGGKLPLNGGWLYINPTTNIFVYKEGNSNKINFKVKNGNLKWSETFPVDDSIINDYVINPPKPKEKTLNDYVEMLDKIKDGWTGIKYDKGIYYYGENKLLPESILQSIKNGVKNELNIVKNEINKITDNEKTTPVKSTKHNLSFSNIGEYIMAVETEAKNMGLI